MSRLKIILQAINNALTLYLEFLSEEFANLLQILTSIVIFILYIKVPNYTDYSHYFYIVISIIILYIVLRAWFFYKKINYFKDFTNSLLIFGISSVLIIITIGINLIFLIKIILPVSINQGVQNCIVSGYCPIKK